MIRPTDQFGKDGHVTQQQHVVLQDIPPGTSDCQCESQGKNEESDSARAGPGMRMGVSWKKIRSLHRKTGDENDTLSEFSKSRHRKEYICQENEDRYKGE